MRTWFLESVKCCTNKYIFSSFF